MNVQMKYSSVGETVFQTLEDFVRDWALEAEITSATTVVGDLEFDSIDVIQFTVALETAFGGRKLGFQDLLMQNGRYVDDLSLGQFQDFLEMRLTSA